MALYGLTCGYWTDDPEDLDDHVIRHHDAGNDDQLFDLFEDRDIPNVIPRDCGDGIS